ncbi:MAG: hypothetical protein HWD86_04415 [Kangiellaceae bacterium]|nr:hypothetical protein [Kangiellaceae bacterium]
MNLGIVIGFAINALCLLHFSLRGGFTRTGKLTQLLTIILLLIPYLGALIYFVWFVWQPPAPSPSHLQQKRWNHYGKSEALGDYEQVIENQKGQTNVQKEYSTKSKNLLRTFLIVFGFLISIYGSLSIRDGDWFYQNHWGLNVFGPISILCGILMIAIGIFSKMDE